MQIVLVLWQALLSHKSRACLGADCSCQFVGLVFFAFAFNMVDCGGLLGGRLGNNINMHAASLKKAKVGALS